MKPMKPLALALILACLLMVGCSGSGSGTSARDVPAGSEVDDELVVGGICANTETIKGTITDYNPDNGYLTIEPSDPDSDDNQVVINYSYRILEDVVPDGLGVGALVKATRYYCPCDDGSYIAKKVQVLKAAPNSSDIYLAMRTTEGIVVEHEDGASEFVIEPTDNSTEERRVAIDYFGNHVDSTIWDKLYVGCRVEVTYVISTQGDDSHTGYRVKIFDPLSDEAQTSVE